MHDTAELIHSAIQEIETFQHNETLGYIRKGELLNVLLDKKKKLYKQYADHIKTMGDFLREIGISYDQASKMRRSATKFGAYISKLNLSIKPTRLNSLLFIKMNNGDIEEWLHAAAELPASGFTDAIRVAQGKTPMDACEHKSMTTIEVCEECNFRKRVQ